MIQIEHIAKKYDKQVALSDVNLSLQTGQIIGLLGLNGAGKSTLMRILAGIVSPDEGRILFCGKKFSVSSKELKSQIGYLSEDNPLYTDMYVKEYLYYVAGIYGIAKSRADHLIEKLGLKAEYNRKIKTLSKGNRQRVGIAQSLINDPKFLILDEATSGLDPEQRENLINYFKEISENKVILFSTHILEEIKGLCSRFVFIERGTITIDEQVSEINQIEILFDRLKHENSSR